MKRVKHHAASRVESGPGLPTQLDNLVHPKGEKGRDKFSKSLKFLVEKNLIKSRKKLGLHPDDSEISQLSMSLNLDEYTFEDEVPQVLDPKGKNQEVTLDVTALDRYNEDIRKYRKLIVEQCRILPTIGQIPDIQLEKMSSAVINLCRGAYYGTIRAQFLAGGAIPLIIWILNRNNLPNQLHFIILRSLSELLHESTILKSEFVKASGVKVLVRFLRHYPDHPDESQMAVYTLTMASIGSAEVIQEARNQKDMEDLVAELSFEYYWFNWPVNYGKILQGILYGPYSLSPSDDIYLNL